jgi:hypothetical protein
VTSCASDSIVETQNHPGLSFRRRLHGKPDLLAKRELERMAVGVGNPHGIADRVAGIDRSAGPIGRALCRLQSGSFVGCWRSPRSWRRRSKTRFLRRKIAKSS